MNLPSSSTSSLPGSSGKRPAPSSSIEIDEPSSKRRTLKNHAHRRSKRQAERARNPEAGRASTTKKVKKHVLPAQSTTTTYSTSDIPSASTGYVALRGTKGRVYSLHDLVNVYRFTLVKAQRNQAPRAFLDKNGLVVAVLVGEPNDPEWASVHRSAHELLRESAQRCDFQKKKHRRGNFLVLNVGIAFGMGLPAPANLTHSAVNTEELRKILSSRTFVRIAGFQSSCFRTWAPKLNKHYGTTLDNLTEHHPALERNFANSVWACAALNFGPRTVTAKHRDTENLPFGWCCVTAFGDFDYTLGGHIVLWDLKLVLEFPPGFTVLLPSAAVAHSNTPIQPHETRTSFTQFTAGGIFRWVEHGYQNECDFTKDFTDEDWARIATENAERCKLGAKLFSTLDELRASTSPRKEKEAA